jgi:hypothetical protein
MGAVFFALCLITFGFGAIVDPYYIFDSPRIPGWTMAKPAAGNRAVAAKARLMESSQPRTLLLGNSRIEVGFNPDSPAWPAGLQPVFNAGLSGRDLPIAAKMFEDLLTMSEVRYLIVGLDVLDFIRPETTPESSGRVYAGSDQDRLHSDMASDFRVAIARAQDVFEATLTIDATIDSVTTILTQGSDAPTTSPRGFNPLNEYVAYVRSHGFRDLFEQKQRQYVARFAAYRPMTFADPSTSLNFRALREILTTARLHQVEVVLIIYPYHAWVMDLLRQTGLWTTLEEWKRAVVRVSSMTDQSGHTRIIDFSGYNAYTTEEVPSVDDTSSIMRWYWEPGHFRPALGDRIIGRLFGEANDGFGRDLTPETIEPVIAVIRAEADARK